MNNKRIACIKRNIKSFRAAEITEEEWQYMISKWTKNPKFKDRNERYVKEIRSIYEGESLVSVAKRTNRATVTLGCQMRKGIQILNKYIKTLPTYKTAKLLES